MGGSRSAKGARRLSVAAMALAMVAAGAPAYGHGYLDGPQLVFLFILGGCILLCYVVQRLNHWHRIWVGLTGAWATVVWAFAMTSTFDDRRRLLMWLAALTIPPAIGYCVALGVAWIRRLFPAE